jgi:glycosyltransferase involved in cell wall biosynthesis
VSTRLLYVVNNASFFLSHRLPVAAAAQRAGFDVQVVTPDGPSVPAIRDAGLTWHPVALSRSGMSLWSEAQSMLQLYRLYQRLRPDIVHHVTPKPVLYGTPAARLAGVPAVVNAISGLGHAFSPGAGRLLRAGVSLGYRVALRHPNMRVIFQNDEHRRQFIRSGWVRAADAELVPGSGVDVQRFRPAPPGYTSPTGPVTVMLAARLLATKGVREFVAAARLLRDPARARFVLVGDPDPGNPASIPAAEIAQWVREGVVEHWGFQRDMAQGYSTAQIACLPSYTEGMPKSLIEAAACGLLIVATDEPGCRAVVIHETSGLLVPVGDVRALAHQLDRAIAEPALRARLGQAARHRAVTEFAIEHIVARHLEIYRGLTTARAGGPT